MTNPKEPGERGPNLPFDDERNDKPAPIEKAPRSSELTNSTDFGQEQGIANPPNIDKKINIQQLLGGPYAHLLSGLIDLAPDDIEELTNISNKIEPDTRGGALFTPGEQQNFLEELSKRIRNSQAKGTEDQSKE